MTFKSIGLLTAVISVFVAPVTMSAHHGSAISYDMEHTWTTKAVVTEFQYKNPHPWLEFDRMNDKGETEHWVAELITNPTFLLRAGWTKARSIEALKPGTGVELTLATARAGGFNAVIRTIRNEQGEYIVSSGGLGGDSPVLFPTEAPSRGGPPPSGRP